MTWESSVAIIGVFITLMVSSFGVWKTIADTSAIRKQFKNNSGHSMKDQMDQLKEKLDTLSANVQQVADTQALMTHNINAVMASSTEQHAEMRNEFNTRFNSLEETVKRNSTRIGLIEDQKTLRRRIWN